MYTCIQKEKKDAIYINISRRKKGKKRKKRS